MKELGLKTYRFSISWARIIPDGDGEVNQKGIDFYNQVIDELIGEEIGVYKEMFRKYGIEGLLGVM